MADISLGEGIGLGFKMPYDDFAVHHIEKIQNEHDKALKEARQRAKQRQADIDQYSADFGKFFIARDKGLLPGYEEPVKAGAADIYNTMKQKLAKDKEYNPNNDYELQKKMTNLFSYMDTAQLSSKNYLEHAKMSLTNPDNYDVNSDMQKNIEAGDYKSLRNAFGGHDHYVGGLITAKDKTDWYKEANNAGQDTKPTVREFPTGENTSTEKQQFTPAEKETAWNNYKTGRGSKLILSAYNQLRTTNPSATPEQAENMVKYTFIKAIPDVLKQNQTKESGGDKSNYSVTPSIDKEINVNIQNMGGGVKTSPITAKKSWELKANIPIQKEFKETINPQTWEKEAPVGGQQFTIGSIIELPVLKTGKDAGKPVRESVAKQYPDQIEYKKYASGTISKKVDVVDENGAVVKDANGVVKQTVRTVPTYIDYDVVEPTLREKKINLEGVNDKTTPSKSTAKTIPASSVKALVGKKGYEGYTEKELIDYYASQGYTIK